MDESTRQKKNRKILLIICCKGEIGCVPSDSHFLLISFRCLVAMAYVKSPLKLC